MSAHVLVSSKSDAVMFPANRGAAALQLSCERRRIGRRLRLEAARTGDDLVGLLDRRVRAVVVASRVVVGEAEQARRIASLGVGERFAEHGPLRPAVERGDGGVDHDDLVAESSVRVRDRFVVELFLQCVPCRADIAALERTLGVRLAPLGPVVERVLESDELCLVLLIDRVARRLEGRVEHHGPYAIGEHRRVDTAEVGAV